MTSNERNKLSIISAYMGNPLTEEQMEFACDFRDNTISFSDPGTGKTHSTTAGLIMAQSYHEVPGDSIYCMSYTREATAEVSTRYKSLAKRMGVTANINFGTFHSLSRQIMKEAYPTMEITSGIKWKEDVPRMGKIMSAIGVDATDNNYVKQVLMAVMSLNNSFSFDPLNLEDSYKYKKLNIDVDAFQEIRKRWFLSCLTQKQITRGDIPQFCLNALLHFEHVIPKWRGKYKIMVVDEFQDFSLLYLRILSLIAENLVVIGDIKQQIYGFNGACTQIVEEYMSMYPDAKIKNLTQSFRCKDEIVKFSKEIITPNKPFYGTGEFKGTGEGGCVSIVSRSDFDWSDMFGKIKKDIDDNTLARARDVLFLYRNNASATPVVEALYKEGIPFRCPKFSRVMDLPIFKDLCAMADVAEDPFDVEKCRILMRLSPEFSKLPISEDAPPIQLMRRTGKDIFSIPYNWDDSITYKILIGVRRAQIAMEKGASASIVLNHCLEVFDKYVINGKWWRYEMDKDFYMRLVAPVCSEKTYKVMVYEENEKYKKNSDCITGGMGVRCYTMHSAKGLEADDVYILDAEGAMFPNQKEMKRMCEAECEYQAAKSLRDERNLLFVACTRAKENVVISYSDECTPLLATPEETPYNALDPIYFNHKVEYNDMKFFYDLFNMRRGEKKDGKGI